VRRRERPHRRPDPRRPRLLTRGLREDPRRGRQVPPRREQEAGVPAPHTTEMGRMVFRHLTPLNETEGDLGAAELPQMLFTFSVSPVGFLLCFSLLLDFIYIRANLSRWPQLELFDLPSVHKTRLLYQIALLRHVATCSCTEKKPFTT
jgi:hypothetical protein